MLFAISVCSSYITIWVESDQSWRGWLLHHHDFDEEWTVFRLFSLVEVRQMRLQLRYSWSISSRLSRASITHAPCIDGICLYSITPLAMQIATFIAKLLQVYKRLMPAALIHIQFLRVYHLVAKTAKDPQFLMWIWTRTPNLQFNCSQLTELMRRRHHRKFGEWLNKVKVV